MSVKAATRGQGPAAPSLCVSPTRTAGRTTASPATAWWRPGLGARLPPTPPTTSSWPRIRGRTSRLVREHRPGVGGTGWGPWGNSETGPWGPGPPPGSGLGELGQDSVPGEAGGSPPLPSPPSASLFLCPVTSDPKEEGLEAQVSRLAELIGRLENRVSPRSSRLCPPARPPGSAELGWGTSPR